MGGVVSGFVAIASVIGAGYVLGRRRLLGGGGREVLTRLAFHVASPALLFETLAGTDLSALLSGHLLVTAASTLAVAGVFAGVAAVRRWSTGYSTVGTLCAGYVNAGNLGIPVAAYVLGDASLMAPVLLLQLLVFTPVFLAVLDSTTSRVGAAPLRRLTSPFRNPIVVGSLAGAAVSASGWTPPEAVLEPFRLLGAMAIPAVLLAFGISLRGSAVLSAGADRGPVLLAVALKGVAHPLVAWALGAGVFGLSGAVLCTVVVTAALPSAQNVFTYATHYDVGVGLAREAVLLSTVVSVPVLLTVAALLG
ncbi:AEC family transporter [Streptomyces sp. AJS327]|uniref:AEC family transporter n=1 Tax=Streptomyces sp. AJS327 TaxID=2545265 RepID=UPI0015DDF3B1|nr:AEC family transporter [Streptomyces sp. AJS327]MBA0051600.1 AEC family transporter [Streptomyces sp. AJS327]